ncbi:MAG: hypothetical protein WC552_08470 [Candidatus Omnitrophota bacterium]
MPADPFTVVGAIAGVFSALRGLKKKMSRKKFKKILSVLTQELLKVEPDMDYVKRQIAHIEDFGEGDSDLEQVRAMAAKVEKFKGGMGPAGYGRGGGAKGVPKRKTAARKRTLRKKRSGKSKAVKKKVGMRRR